MNTHVVCFGVPSPFAPLWWKSAFCHLGDPSAGAAALVWCTRLNEL